MGIVVQAQSKDAVIFFTVPGKGPAHGKKPDKIVRVEVGAEVEHGYLLIWPLAVFARVNGFHNSRGRKVRIGSGELRVHGQTQNLSGDGFRRRQT